MIDQLENQDHKSRERIQPMLPSNSLANDDTAVHKTAENGSPLLVSKKVGDPAGERRPSRGVAGLAIPKRRSVIGFACLMAWITSAAFAESERLADSRLDSMYRESSSQSRSCDRGCEERCYSCDELSTSIWNRPQLTGDWLGTRSALAEHGVAFELYGTQFYQGVAAGGREQDWEYGDKFDYLVRVDGGKAGLWQGLFIDLHGESRLGDSVNNIDGLVAPSNIAMSLPQSEGNVTALTGVKVTQALSEQFAVFGGKINTLDEYPLRFSPELGLGRPGIGGFMNTSLVFNPIAARTIPYAAAGVGAAVLREGQPVFVFSVFDPEERATTGLQGLYERGVVLVPDFTFRLQPFGLPGLYNVGGTYSNARYRSVDRAAYLSLPNLGVIGNEESGSWSLYANLFQTLWIDPCDANRKWGVFGQFGISDGNPNPIQYVINGGVAGRSTIRYRELDTFGVGAFYLGLSDEFKALAAPVLPQQDGYGLELFYNIAVTPWCRVTADLQVARPSTQGLDTAVIPGMRMEIVF